MTDNDENSEDDDDDDDGDDDDDDSQVVGDLYFSVTLPVIYDHHRNPRNNDGYRQLTIIDDVDPADVIDHPEE